MGFQINKLGMSIVVARFLIILDELTCIDMIRDKIMFHILDHPVTKIGGIARMKLNISRIATDESLSVPDNC